MVTCAFSADRFSRPSVGRGAKAEARARNLKAHIKCEPRPVGLIQRLNRAASNLVIA